MQTMLGGAHGGVWQSLRMAGIWSQAVDFLLVNFRESGLSHHEDMFVLNLLYNEML
jgi:hypothetical protein